jgi:hypothetical protein
MLNAKEVAQAKAFGMHEAMSGHPAVGDMIIRLCDEVERVNDEIAHREILGEFWRDTAIQRGDQIYKLEKRLVWETRVQFVTVVTFLLIGLGAWYVRG